MRTFTIVPSFEGNSAYFELPDIGFQGDNLSFAILFNLTELTEHWVNILPSMIITDPKNNTFLATHTRWDSAKHIFTWFVSETETRYDGVLKCQLKCVSSDDPETVVCMSQICQTRVYKSLEAASDPPEAFQSWLDALERLAAEVHADLEYTLENVENIDEMISGVSDDIETITNNINSKMSKPTNEGTLDQVLYNNGDGTTRWDDPITEEDVKDAVGEWMDENIPSGTTIALDPTLSIPNTAAEAAVTGNRLAGLQKNVEDYKVNPDLLVSYKQAVPGNTVEVYDAVPEAVKQMQIAIEPVQDLNGYTKPWAPGGGKNKLDLSTVTVDDVTFTPDSDGYVSSSSTEDSRTWSYSKSQYKLSLPAGSYKLVWETKTATTSAARGYRVYDDSNTVLVDGYTTVLDTDGSSATFTLSDTTNIGVMIKQYNMVARFMIISSTDSVEWEPYANVCPISGFTVCDVTVDVPQFGRTEGAYINANGVFVNDNGFAYSDFITVSKGSIIKICGTKNNSTAQWRRLHIYDENFVWKRQVDAVNPSSIGDYTLTGIVAEGEKYIRLSYGIDDTNINISNVYTITFPDSQTIYGGTLTINRDGTGTLTVDKILHDNLKTRTWTMETIANGNVFSCNAITGKAQNSNYICNKYNAVAKARTAIVNGEIGTYNVSNAMNRFSICDNAYSTVADFVASLDDLEVCFEINDPQSYTLTIPQVQMLLCYNKIYANTGDILLLEYPVERHQLADQAEKERVHKVLDAEYGAVISEFDDGADNAPMAMKIKFEPKQDLHGYDKPWVGGAGKNLFDGNKINGYISDDGTEGTDGANAHSDYIKVTSGQTYTYSWETSLNIVVNRRIHGYKSDKSWDQMIEKNVTTASGSKTFTVPSGVEYIRVQFLKNDSDYDIQVELGSTASEWEPYSNICQISGFTGCEVARGGQNLYSNKLDYIFQTGGTNFKDNSNGTITVNATANTQAGSVCVALPFIIPAQTPFTFFIKSSKASNDVGVRVVKMAGSSFINYGNPIYITDTEVEYSGQFAVDATHINVFVKTNHGDVSDVTLDIYFTIDYSTYTITFPQAAGTVYGGTLTVNKDGTGSLVVDRKQATVPDDVPLEYSSNTKTFYMSPSAILAPDIEKKTYTESFRGICDKFKAYNSSVAWANVTDTLVGYSYSGSANLGNFRFSIPWLGANDIEVAKGIIAGTNIVYYLDEPVAIQLAVPQIRSILGTNHIWSNDGEIIHLEYSKDIETVLDDHVDAINAISIRETVENYEEENVISIPDGADGAPMALTVGIEPVQDKHGYDNPWPGRASKNKLRLILSDIMSFNSNWEWTGKTATLSGITVEVLTDSDDNILGFTANGQATASIWFVFRRFEDNEILIDGSLKIGGYVSTAGSPSTTFGYQMYFKNNNGSNVIATGISNNYLTITNTVSTGDTSPNYSSFVFRNGVSVSNLVFKPMILLTSETNYDFVPYSNICPITGWTGAEITRTGADLIKYSDLNFVANQYIEYTDGTIKSANGYTYTQNYIKVTEGKTYTYCNDKTVTTYARGAYAIFYDKDKNFMPNESIILLGNTTEAVFIREPFTVPEGAVYVRFTNPYATEGSLRLISGTDVDENGKHEGQTYSITFPSEVGAVYDGTLTVNKDGTGELVVEKKCYTLGNIESLSTAQNGKKYGTYTVSDKLDPIGYTYHPTTIFEIFKSTYYNARGESYSGYVGSTYNIIIFFDTDTTLEQANSMASGTKVVCELATPITYNISAPVVKSLLGTNNIWADTGKILSVDYTRDTTMAVNSKVDTAYYEWQMQQTWDNIDTKAIPMSSIAYDIIHDYEKRRSL